MARHKNEDEGTKTILKRWWVGAVAKLGENTFGRFWALRRTRLRRAGQRHGGEDSDGEDRGRTGDEGDAHGGAVRREETPAKEEGVHVQVVAEDVEGWRD